MSCRRAYELDLPAFVIDPRDPAWDDFRAHYPRCADCAVEVATWSALQAALAERHPEPEDLLRWNDGPDALAADARASIARHLERCASCRDELRALGTFAGSSASTPAAHAAGGALPAAVADGSDAARVAHEHHPSASRPGGRRAERHAFARPGSVSGAAHGGTQAADDRPTTRRGPVVRVLLHPGFAYAVLALVLLLPTVRAALDRDAGRAAFDAASGGAADGARRVASSPVAEQPPRLQDVAPAAAPAEQRTQPARPRSEEPAANARPITDFARAQRDAGSDGAVAQPPASLDDARVDRTAPRLVRQAPARPVAPTAEAPAPAPGRPADSAPAAAPPAGASVRTAESTGAAAAFAGKAVTPGASDEPASLARAGDAHGGSAFRLKPAAPDGTRDLVVTLPPSLSSAERLEVRIVDASGGRELRQRVARARHADPEVQVPLPAGFNAPVLRVEVYADDVGPLLQGFVGP